MQLKTESSGCNSGSEWAPLVETMPTWYKKNEIEMFATYDEMFATLKYAGKNHSVCWHN